MECIREDYTFFLTSAPLPVNPLRKWPATSATVSLSVDTLDALSLLSDSSAISGSIPDLSDISSLDKSIFDYTTLSFPASETRDRILKPKHSRCIEFENVDEHPLISNFDGEMPSRENISSTSPSTVSKPVKPTLMHKRTKQRRLPVMHGCEPVVYDECDDGPEEELQLYNIKTVALSVRTNRRFPRANTSYLRMFVAEKDMILAGKLNRINCGPYKMPRMDPFSNEPTKLLGIVCEWRKKRAHRQWAQLNP